MYVCIYKSLMLTGTVNITYSIIIIIIMIVMIVIIQKSIEIANIRPKQTW